MSPLRRGLAAGGLAWLSLAAPAPAPAEVVIPGLDAPPPGHVEPLRFGALLTLDAAAGDERVTKRGDGFDVPDARLSLAGALELGFDYFVQANLVEDTPLLDLVLSWEASELGFRVSAGYFRVPFSGELQVAAPYLDLLDRSQIVNAVAGGRQVGLEVSQRLWGPALVLRAGAFNGSGLETNDNDEFLYTLRLEGEQPLPLAGPGDSRWRIGYGASGSYTRDEDVRLGLDLPRSFRGERIQAGLDLRLSSQRLLFSAEGLYARLDPFPGSVADVYGYQATVGWRPGWIVQLLARYDAFHGDGLGRDLDLAIASLVFDFTPWVSLQGELRVPTRGAAAVPSGIVDLTFAF